MIGLRNIVFYTQGGRSIMQQEKNKYYFETKTVHSGQYPDPYTGAITTPIYQTATYVLDEIGKDKNYQYARTNNPTRTVLENLMADLEGSKYGVAFSSGMSAADAIIRACLKTGEHVIVGDDVYGGIYRLFEKNYRKYGLEFSYVDTTDIKNIEKKIIPTTRIIWLESPTNPLLKVSDIIGICKLIENINKQRSANNKIITVVDNTFMTPYFMKPLELGADIVFHSTSKYISGHNQLIGGIVIIRDDDSKWYYGMYEKITFDPKTAKSKIMKFQNANLLYENISFIQNAIGAIPSPFDCWLTITGLKTLALRMKKHEENAIKIVEFLKEHPSVKKVYYPGIESHLNHKIAAKQMSGFGGMISFELKGSIRRAIKFMNSVKLWSLAESLGAVESMVSHPASMTHVSVPAEIRHARGISDALIRLSVGIESADDLIADLDQALKASARL